MIKKIILTLCILLVSIKAEACNCWVPKPIIEFQGSEYVFEGKVISKTYASDSLTYTVNFEILKHYKKSDNPKSLEFTIRSEGRYTGEFTSCDWSIDNDEIWLIYAYYRNNKLTFEYHCSNSGNISLRGIPKSEQNVLNIANEFEIDKYTFIRSDGGFSSAKPKTNVDSLLTDYNLKDYGKNYDDIKTTISVDIDKYGNILSANLYSIKHIDGRELNKRDLIYRLKRPENKEVRKPKNEFEKDMLEVVKKLNKWEVTYIERTEIAVRIRKIIQIYKEPNTIEMVF